MSKFKVGDRVRVNGNHDKHWGTVCGTVIEVTESKARFRADKGSRYLDGKPIIESYTEDAGFWRNEYLDLIESTVSSLDIQEGGSHYKNMAIQPVEYIMANDLGFCEGAVVKYVSRYKAKNGVEDLRKARHFIDMMIEREEKAQANG